MIIVLYSIILAPYNRSIYYEIAKREVESHHLYSWFYPDVMDRVDYSAGFFIEPGGSVRRDDRTFYVAAGGEVRYGNFNFLYKMKANYIGDFRNPISDTANYDGHVWKGKIIEEDRYGVGIYSSKNFMVFAGLTPVHSGPLHHSSLIISENARSLELFGFGLNGLSLNFRYFFTQLERDRFLSFHRLELNREWFSLAITETVLFEDSLPYLGYMNPFFLYYAVQWNDEWMKEKNDNILWDADFSILYKNMKFYGELLIDDIMYEPTPAPNKLGYGTGIFLNFNKLNVLCEYIMVDKWVYTHHEKRENTYVRYVKRDTVRGWVLGDSLGPDSDHFHLDLYWDMKRKGYLALKMGIYRKGEGSIWVPYREGEDVNPPFPSGIVEKSFIVRASYNISSSYDRFGIEVGYEFISNYAHVENQRNSGIIFNVYFHKYLRVLSG